MSNNDNSGALFKNDKKRDGKKDADYTGNITIDGKEYWLNAWVNETQEGRKFFGLRVKEKTAKTTTKASEGIPF